MVPNPKCQPSGWEEKKTCPLCKDKAKEKNLNFSAKQLYMGFGQVMFYLQSLSNSKDGKQNASDRRRKNNTSCTHLVQ